MNISLSQISQILFAAERIVITGHIHPDGDCLGSMLALYRFLQARHGRVSVMLDDDIPSFYRFLPDLQVIQKPAASDADLLIVVDASDVERIGKVRELVPAPILNIDHHISNTQFADYLYLDPTAAATGSILFELFRLEKYTPDELTATCLYTAIATDCGFFRYANTTPDTMRYAADLLACGVQPAAIVDALERKPAKGIFTLIRVLETLELAADGKVACITVPADILAEGESTDDYINYPRNIDGVEIAVVFKQTSPLLTRVSLRSQTVDVSEIALSFGGGGHKRAAGCSIEGSFADAKKMLLQAVTSALKDVP